MKRRFPITAAALALSLAVGAARADGDVIVVQTVASTADAPFTRLDEPEVFEVVPCGNGPIPDWQQYEQSDRRSFLTREVIA